MEERGGEFSLSILYDDPPSLPPRMHGTAVLYCTGKFIRCLLKISAGNLRPAMGARNQVGIGLSYRPASLCSLAT
jgi:hypothetical protein